MREQADGTKGSKPIEDHCLLRIIQVREKTVDT